MAGQRIKLVDRDGGWYEATVELELYRSSASPAEIVLGDPRLCRVTLRWERGELVGRAWDFFSAFCQVREQLEVSGVFPHCYGASRKVILRGTDRDMVAGQWVWKAELGQRLARESVVHILASGPDVEPATVAEQREFQREWHGPSWPLMRRLLDG